MRLHHVTPVAQEDVDAARVSHELGTPFGLGAPGEPLLAGRAQALGRCEMLVARARRAGSLGMRTLVESGRVLRIAEVRFRRDAGLEALNHGLLGPRHVLAGPSALARLPLHAARDVL